jgi:hypothetical protein
MIAGSRPDQRGTPQVPPVAQDEVELPRENPLPPEIFEAKEETFLRTWGLPHSGQRTSLIKVLLRSSSSKGVPHSLHSNSKIGIFAPLHRFQKGYC